MKTNRPSSSSSSSPMPPPGKGDHHRHSVPPARASCVKHQAARSGITSKSASTPSAGALSRVPTQALGPSSAAPIGTDFFSRCRDSVLNTPGLFGFYESGPETIAIDSAISEHPPLAEVETKQFAKGHSSAIPEDDVDEVRIRDAIHHLTIKRKGDRADKVELRTRYDVLRYADQITTAGRKALDETNIALAQFAADHHRSGISFEYDTYVGVCGELNKHVRGLPLTEGFSGLRREELQRVNSLDLREAVHAIDQLRAAYRTPVSEHNTDYIELADGQMRQTQQVCYDLTLRLIDKYRQQITVNSTLSAAKKQSMLSELDGIQKAIGGHVFDARKEYIHSQKGWDGRPMEYPVTLHDLSHHSLTAISEFRALVKKSSQEPREQPADDPQLAGLFDTCLCLPSKPSALSGLDHSSLSLSGPSSPSSSSGFEGEIAISPERHLDVAEGLLSSSSESLEGSESDPEPAVEGGERLCRAKRHATFVEFGVDDPERRAATTEANVGVVVRMQADEQLAEMTDFSGNSAGNPVIVKCLSSMLLTPDAIRVSRVANQLKKIHRCDKERLLVEESKVAIDRWNGRTEVRTVIDSATGLSRQVHVRYVVAACNIPCNKTQEKIVRSPLSFWAASHEMTDQMNRDTLQMLGADRTQELVKMNARIDELKKNKLMPTSRAARLQALIDEKAELRKRIFFESTLRGTAPNQALLDAYTGVSSSLVDFSKRLLGAGASEERKEYLELIAKREMLEDLYAQVHFLVTTTAYMSPEVLDGNRYAIGSRILALGEMLGWKIDFGCRSGKDRTGIQDADWKQLIMETRMMGRVPAFFEVEKWKCHKENTDTMLLNSGNAHAIPKLFLGGVGWLRVSGAARTDPRSGEEPEIYAKLVSAAKITSFPWTIVKKAS